MMIMLKKKLFLERKALPKGAVFLLAFLILAFFLMSLCMSVSGVVAKEPTTLPKSRSVDAEIKSIHYEKVYGTEMVKNGTEVSIKVVLTNISGEIGKSTLTFYSELEGAKGGIMEEVLKSGSSYTMDPQKVGEEVVVIWSGTAPEVRKQETFTLLNITQETTEGKYVVEDIKEDVSSEIIYDALSAWHKAKEEIGNANRTIANATKADVEEAKTSLDLAKEHLNNSLDFYNTGRPEEALEEANKASEYAEDAKKLAEGAKTTRRIRGYSVLAAAVVIAIVVFVFLIRQRRRKRGVY
jgi:hypothetical protein